MTVDVLVLSNSHFHSLLSLDNRCTILSIFVENCIWAIGFHKLQAHGPFRLP
jgi:hypothetical protein